MLLQMLGISTFSLQNSPSLPSAWLRSWASLMRPSAQPTVSFITYCMVIPRSIPFARVGWGGTEGVPLQGLNLLFVFAFQYHPEAPHHAQHYDLRGGCPAWEWSDIEPHRYMHGGRILQCRTSCVKTDVMNVVYCYLFFGNTKFTWFEIQNLLRKKNWKFHISSTHWFTLPRSNLKAFFRRYSLQTQGNTHQQSLMVGCHFFPFPFLYKWQHFAHPISVSLSWWLFHTNPERTSAFFTGLQYFIVWRNNLITSYW